MFVVRQRWQSRCLLYLQYSNFSKTTLACPCACDTMAVMQDSKLQTALRLTLEAALGLQILQDKFLYSNTGCCNQISHEN